MCTDFTTVDTISSIDIKGFGTVIPGNKVNPKSIILDILFIVVFLPNFKEIN